MVKAVKRRKGVTYTLYATADPLYLLREQKVPNRVYDWAYDLEVFVWSSWVVIARHGAEVVGVFGIDTKRSPQQTQGTYVVSKWRRKGIASTMWEVAMLELGITHLASGTITKAGSSFVRSVVRNKKRGYQLDHSRMESLR